MSYDKKNYELESFEDIEQYYGEKLPSQILKDKKFTPKGIDYSRFLKIKYDLINKNLIRDYYTIDGWYLITWLMVNSATPYYISTTIDQISNGTDFKVVKIKELLKYLESISAIKISSKTKNVKSYDTINIAIIYNTSYSIEDNGYMPFPIEYIKNILPTLKPNEWAVYNMLIIRYSYFSVQDNSKDIPEGTPIIYSYSRNHYAFPTFVDIMARLKLGTSTLSNIIQSLLNNKYNLIEKSQADRVPKKSKITGKLEFSAGNNKYELPIMERIEFVYYCIYRFNTDEYRQEHENIKKIGFETIANSSDQKILEGKKYLYILEYYSYYMKEYEQCIKNNDEVKYNELRQMKISKNKYY